MAAQHRFADLTSDDILAKRAKVIPKNTINCNLKSARTLRSYLVEKKQDVEFEKYSPERLSETLKFFYLEVDARTPNGKLYKSTSLENFRYCRQELGMADDIKVPGNVEEWLEFWNTHGGECDMPETEPCPMLQKHLDRLVNGKPGAKIFVPLCTKTIDMKWLSDQGHVVVGLEAAEGPVKGFFKEQKLEFTIESGLGGKCKIYKAKTGNIKIYVADFFDFNKDAEGVFDGVWDRRAMIAINTDQYQRYVALIKSLLTADGRVLFVNADFDRTKCPGPHMVTEEMLRDLYKPEYKVEYVMERNRSEKDEPEELCGFDWFLEKMFLITKA